MDAFSSGCKVNDFFPPQCENIADSTLMISTAAAAEMTAEETDADAAEAMTRNMWTERMPEAA